MRIECDVVKFLDDAVRVEDAYHGNKAGMSLSQFPDFDDLIADVRDDTAFDGDEHCCNSPIL